MILSLSNSPIQSIQVYSALFPMDQPNKRPVHCRDCEKHLLPGLAIRRRLWRRNGYICLSCFESFCGVSTFAFGSPDNDAGFYLPKSDPGLLRACVYGPRTFTTKQVTDSVRVAMLEKGETIADSLMGERESMGPVRLGDLAEVLLSGV